MAKRFVEIVHNMNWDSDGNVNKDINEQRELIPIDNITKVWQHILGKNGMERAIAVDFYDPCDGRRRRFLELVAPGQLRCRWDALKKQLDHLLERSEGNG